MASVWLWLDTGSADEAAEHAGVAHFLEHMLFKGTTARGIGVASGEIERAGGDLNAFTTWDHTVLHATVRSGAWRTAVDVLADLARNPVFDPEELARERDVVLDEIRSYDEDVAVAVNDRLRAELWRDHPYGRPVLGFPTTVSALDRDAVHRYWSRNWTANRALLVAAGPVEPEALFAAAAAELGGWVAGGPRTPIASAPPVSARAVKITHPFETAEIQVGWRAPGIEHPDLHALGVAAAVLGQGSASTLSEELQLELGVVGDAWASYSSAPVGGTFTLGLAPTEDRSADAIVAALEIVDRLRRGGLSGSRISRARDGMLAQLWFDHETADGIASDAAWFTARYGDPDAAEVHRRALAAIQPEDVYAAAERWLDPDRAVLVAADPTLKQLPKAWKQARTPRARPVRDGQPVLTTLDNGARIVVLPDEGKLAAVRLGALGGALTVRPRVAGLAAAWSDLVAAGCGPWDAVEVRRRVDDLSASFGASASPSAWSLSSSFPASELEDGVALIGEALVDPHFDVEEWDRVQHELFDEIRTLPDRPWEIAANELAKLMWSGHPWALPFTGTAATIGRISPTTIRRWHEAHTDPTRLVVGVAGGVDPAWATDVVGDWLTELTPRGPIPARPAPRPAPRGVHRRTAGQHQATVIASVPTGSWQDPDRHALTLASGALEGPSGRLFLELRERLGLGYDVWSEYRVGLDGGTFTVGLTCAPGRVDEARVALVDQVARLQAEGPAEDELARCRELLDGDLARLLQRVSGRASHLAFATLFDRPWRPEAIAAERAAVGPSEVRAALERIRADEPVVLVVRPK